MLKLAQIHLSLLFGHRDFQFELGRTTRIKFADSQTCLFLSLGGRRFIGEKSPLGNCASTLQGFADLLGFFDYPDLGVELVLRAVWIGNHGADFESVFLHYLYLKRDTCEDQEGGNVHFVSSA